jgi:hypothetical protein
MGSEGYKFIVGCDVRGAPLAPQSSATVLKEEAECLVPSKPFRLPPLATDRSAHGEGRAGRDDRRSLEPRRFGRRHRGAGGPDSKAGSPGNRAAG